MSYKTSFPFETAAQKPKKEQPLSWMINSEMAPSDSGGKFQRLESTRESHDQEEEEEEVEEVEEEQQAAGGVTTSRPGGANLKGNGLIRNQ